MPRIDRIIHNTMLSSASRTTSGHLSRGIRSDSPWKRATAANNNNAPNNEIALNVSGAKSVNASFMIGQFKPQIRVRTASNRLSTAFIGAQSSNEMKE